MWIYFAIGVLLLLAIEAFAVAYYCFGIAFVRGKKFPMNKEYEIENKFEKAVGEGREWYDAQKFREYTVKSFDGLMLYGDYLPAENEKYLVLLFHGYRSNARHDFSAALKFYHDSGCSILLVTQRAHGKSEGKYITFGCLERYDVLSWANFASEKFPSSKIFLDGISMGASCVLLAANTTLPKNVRGIIADCGFTSPLDILKHVAKNDHIGSFPVLNIMRLYARLFGHFKLKGVSTEKALSETTLPVLFVHGLDDKFVPPEMSRRNFNACASAKRLITVKGAAHGESYLVDCERCQSELLTFFKAFGG